MKKLIFAVAILFITAAFEQKASSVINERMEPTVEVVKGLDTLSAKIERYNKLKRDEK